METVEMIKALEETSSKDAAFLLTSWLAHGEGAVLEGNTEGFKLFAAKLLEASAGKPETLQLLFNKTDFETWIFDEAHNFANIVCVYNSPRLKFKSVIPEAPARLEKDKLLRFTFFALMLFSLINFIVGFITIIKWLT